MYKYVLLLTLVVSALLFSSQHPDDVGNFNGPPCQIGINELGIADYISDHYSSVDAYFNDTDGDCISTDYMFIIYDESGNPVEFIDGSYFIDADGNITPWNFGNYNCCDPVSGGTGTGGGTGSGGSSGGGSDGLSDNTDGCSCQWSGEPGDWGIFCPCMEQ